MIRRFTHKGLERLHNTGSASGVKGQHVNKLIRILSVLDYARSPADLAIPGFRAHPLHGNDAGRWSLRVSANWRVTCRFTDGDVTDVDYVDYH